MKTHSLNAKIIGKITMPNQADLDGILVVESDKITAEVLEDGLMVINDGQISVVNE